ncbi:hypothetical protein, partial [Nocardia sp. NPDC005745]|uniref:hypothetical protein n=1 Tax=Nocardia sp. NPDC005745 TaxID=3157061 RepID=UPI00340F3323
VWVKPPAFDLDSMPLRAPSSRTRRPRKREPGRERRMLGLASLETGSGGALGASVSELPYWCTVV